MRKRYDILHRIFEENKRKSKKFVEIQFVVVGSVFRHNAICAMSGNIWNFRLSLRGNEVTVGIQRSENAAVASIATSQHSLLLAMTSGKINPKSTIRHSEGTK